MGSGNAKLRLGIWFEPTDWGRSFEQGKKSPVAEQSALSTGVVLSPQLSGKLSHKVFPSFFAPPKNPQLQALEPKVLRSVERFGKEPVSKNRPSNANFGLDNNTSAKSRDFIQTKISEHYFSGFQNLHLSEFRKAWLQDRLLMILNARDINQVAQVKEQMQLWLSYGELKTRQLLFHQFLSEVYPEEYRHEDPRSLEELSVDPFMLALRNLSVQDRDQFNKLLTEDISIEPQDLNQLIVENDRLGNLYSVDFLERIFSAYERAEISLSPIVSDEELLSFVVTPLLMHESSMEALLGIRSYFSGDLVDVEGTKIRLDEVRGYVDDLQGRCKVFQAIDRQLELELLRTQETVRERYAEVISVQEDEVISEELEDNGLVDFVDYEAEVELDPEVELARRRLEEFRTLQQRLQDLLEQNPLAHPGDGPRYYVEQVMVLKEALNGFEKNWFAQTVERQLSQMSDLNGGEYEDALVHLQNRLENLLVDPEIEAGDYHRFLLDLALYHELYKIKSLSPEVSLVNDLQLRLGEFMSRDELLFSEAEALGSRMQIYKSYAVARQINPDHPRVSELKHHLQSFKRLGCASEAFISKLQRMSQEAALAVTLESRMVFWGKLENSNLQIDGLKDGFGLWGDAAERYEEVSEIALGYSRMSVLLEQGKFEEARRAFERWERNPRLGYWQQKTQRDVFWSSLALEAIGVSESGAASRLVTHSLLAAAKRVNPLAKGLGLLRVGTKVFKDGNKLTLALQQSRRLRALMFSGNVVTFTAVSRYFSQGFQDKNYWDQSLSRGENAFEFAKELTVNGAMFGFLAKVIQIHQARQISKLLPEAALRLESHLGRSGIARLTEEEFKAGLQAEIEVLTRRGASGVYFQGTRFASELGGFAIFEPFGANIHTNLERVKNGEPMEWDSPEFREWMGREAWAHRFAFLVALKVSGVLSHPIPQGLPDPVSEIYHRRIESCRITLLSLLEQEKASPKDVLDTLERYLLAQQEYLVALPKLNFRQRAERTRLEQELIELGEMRTEQEGIETLFSEQTGFDLRQGFGDGHWEYSPAQGDAILRFCEERFGERVHVDRSSGVVELELFDPEKGVRKTHLLTPRMQLDFSSVVGSQAPSISTSGISVPLGFAIYGVFDAGAIGGVSAWERVLSGSIENFLAHPEQQTVDLLPERISPRSSSSSELSPSRQESSSRAVAEASLRQAGWNDAQVSALLTRLAESSGVSVDSIYSVLPSVIEALGKNSWAYERQCNFLIDLAKISGGYVDAAYSILPTALEALSRNNWSCGQQYDFLLHLAKSSGPKFNFSCQRLSKVLDILGGLGWNAARQKQFLSKIIADASQSTGFAFNFIDALEGYAPPGHLEENLQRLSRLLAQLGEHNRKAVLRLLNENDDFFAHLGPENFSQHFSFYVTLFERWPRLGFILLEGLLEATEQGLVPLDISSHRRDIEAFIERAHGFSPAVYAAYLAEGDSLFIALEQYSQVMLSDRLGPLEIAEIIRSRGEEFLLALIQINSPTSGNTFVPRREQLTLLKDRIAAGDLRLHVPEAWRGREESFYLSAGNWVLKPGQTTDSQGVIWDLLGRFRSEDGSRPVAEQEVVRALDAYIRSGRKAEQREELLTLLYRFAGQDVALQETIHRIQGVDYVSLGTLKEIFVDKDQLPRILLRALGQLDPSLWVGQGQKQVLEFNPEGFAKNLNKLWRNGKSKTERLQALAKMVSRFREEDLRAKVLTRDDLSSELKAAIEMVMSHAPDLRHQDLINEVFDPSLGVIEAEMRNYEYENNQTFVLGLRAVKGPAFGMHGLNSGVCVAKDPAVWSNPDFSLLAVVHEGNRQVVGYVHVVEIEVEGKKYLTLPGINPSSEFMGTVEAKEFYDGLMNSIIQLAKMGNYAGVYIPTDSGIHSNRMAIKKVVQGMSYPTKSIPEVVWGKEYPFSQVYVAWEVSHH